MSAASRHRVPPTPPRWPVYRRIPRALFVVGLEVAVAFALLATITADASVTEAPAAPALGADAVAAEPAAFRAGEVVVAGRIQARPERVSDADRTAFVLEGADGGRLLVVPSDGPLPRYRPGLQVLVRGEVVIPPESPRIARRVESRTAVAERARATALLKASEVEVTR